MSIHDEIRARIAEGRLFRLLPIIASDSVDRVMLISKEINDLLMGPWNAKEQERRCARLRADLETFVKGELVAVCLEPYEAKTAYMGRLAPTSDRVWDIRSRDPRPGLRLFGRFAETDTFVALTWAPRSRDLTWSRRGALGAWDTREWRDAIIECKAEWRKLFPSYEPVTGDNLRDYISSNAFLV